MRRQPPTTWGRQECLVPQKAAGCPFGSRWSSSLRLPGISAHGWRSLLRRFKIVGIRCRPMIQRRTDRHRYRACAPFAVPRPQTSRLTFGPFCRSGHVARKAGRVLLFFSGSGEEAVLRGVDFLCHGSVRARPSCGAAFALKAVDKGDVWLAGAAQFNTESGCGCSDARFVPRHGIPVELGRNFPAAIKKRQHRDDHPVAVAGALQHVVLPPPGNHGAILRHAHSRRHRRVPPYDAGLCGFVEGKHAITVHQECDSLR